MRKLSQAESIMEVPQRCVNTLGRGRNLLRRSDVRKIPPPDVRFWAKVDRGEVEICWGWKAATTKGYGVFSPARPTLVYAHRYAYELLIGPIPSGLELDHLCENQLCVNPYHLEPVSHAENMRRGRGWAGDNARKTHCPQGHPYSPDNTYVNPKGSRFCIACRERWKT